jgi:lipopolysaccharide transport system permease protein
MKPSVASLSTAHVVASTDSPIRSRMLHLRDLLRELVVRDLRLRYRGSYLGAAWTLLNPLAELAVLLFIFGVVVPLNIPNYGAFLFTGLLVYGWFQTSLGVATVVIVNNRELIKRPGFPVRILPVVTVASTLVHFFLALPVLLMLLLWSGIHVTAAALMLPVLIAIQFLFTLSLSYPLAAIHVWFRDTQYFLKVALQLLFYLTPVFYDSTTIPAKYLFLYRLNPMAPLVDGYRDVLLRGRVPPLSPLAVITAIATALLFVGLTFFTRTSHRFSDEL